MTFRISFITAGCLLACGVNASSISQRISDLDSSDYEVRQAARLDLRQILVSASSAELRGYEKELIAAIEPDQGFATRDWSIRMLELVGTRAAVKPLATLLDDDDPRIVDLARRALAAIPAGAADTVLEKAIFDISPTAVAGYADALAYRGKPSARNELDDLLAAGSVDAALALGKIASRSSKAALRQAHATAEGEFKVAVELALIDAGISDLDLARTLAMEGQNPAIQAGAFEQLLVIDSDAALKVLSTELTDPNSPNRRVLLRMTMASHLKDEVAAMMGDLPVSDQGVVLGAIADLALNEYEAQVLAFLEAAPTSLEDAAINTLGIIGSDASFEPLLDRYRADNRNRVVASALERLQAPSADANLMATASGDGDIAQRVAALQILALRNSDGTTDLLNQLGRPENDPELRKAAFRGMENAGNTVSIQLLLDSVLTDETDVKWQAQSSLRRLSANLAIADYLWSEFYSSAIASATNDDRRRDVLVILDGASGPSSTAFVREVILSNHPLRPVALRTLQRWTHISAGNLWLEIAAMSQSNVAEVAVAKRGIIRLLTSRRVSGNDSEFVLLAKKSLLTFPDTGFQERVLAAFTGELDWGIRANLKREFPELIDNPAITVDVLGLLESHGYTR